MVKINLNDGSSLEIHSDTVLNGYRNCSNDNVFYMEQVYQDSADGLFSKDGSKLNTVNPQVGFLGFLLSVDCFSVGLDTENNVVYLSSAVKSVENYTPRIGMVDIRTVPVKR